MTEPTEENPEVETTPEPPKSGRSNRSPAQKEALERARLLAIEKRKQYAKERKEKSKPEPEPEPEPKPEPKPEPTPEPEPAPEPEDKTYHNGNLKGRPIPIEKPKARIRKCPYRNIYFLE